MTVISRTLFLSVVLALATVCWGSAADQQKVAVVDMESLIKSHPDTKAAESFLQKQVDEFEAEQKDMMAELEKLKKDFDKAQKEAENKALSDSEREKKKAALDDKYSDLKEQDRKIRETANLRQKEYGDQKLRMRRRIFTKIKDIVKEYAQKKGYVMVLDSSSLSVGGIETVVYVEDNNDITADIRKLVQEQKSDTSDISEKSKDSGKKTSEK